MMESTACDTEKFFLIITQTSLLDLWEVIEKARLDLFEKTTPVPIKVKGNSSHLFNDWQ